MNDLLFGVLVVGGNTVGIALILMLITWLDYRKATPVYDTSGFMAGCPANEAAFEAMPMRERIYWLGRGSSPLDNHYEFILARAFPYEDYDRELAYVQTPKHLRPHRKDIPLATFKALVSLEKRGKL